MFSHRVPTEVVFGAGVSETVAQKVLSLGGKRAFLVTDKGVYGAGVLNSVEKSLNDADIPYVVFTGVEPDPRVESIGEATEQLLAFQADVVIGIGGGSSMDSAKVIAGLAANGGHILDYEGFGKMPKPALPIIEVPTTAGTGSEVTYWAVLTDLVRETKVNVGGWQIYPSIAVVDPLLSLNLPPKITAATGMDALCHAMESYVAKSANPISSALSFKAMTLIAGSLRKAVLCGNNLEARSDMAIGSTIAGMAFNLTRLGLSHAFALPLGGHFHIPHGEVNAITMPHVMQYNLPAATEKYTEVAKLFGENVEGLSPMDAAQKAVDAVKRLSIDIGLTKGLADWGVKESDLDMVAGEAITSGNIAVNPRISNTETLKHVLREAMRGPID